MYHLVVLTFVLFSSVAYQISVARSKRRLRRQTWEDLVRRLRPLDGSVLDNLSQCCSLSCGGGNQSRDARALWTGLGGLRGIITIRANAKTMLELAEYAERWNVGHGAVFAELVRLDVSNLRRLTTKLCLFRLLIQSEAQFRSTLGATLQYYAGLRLRVAAIYQECHAGRLSMLREQL